MDNQKLTRRTVLKMGALAAAGASGLSLASCESEKSDVKFKFDSEIYSDPERAKVPVDQLVKKIEGFKGKQPNIVLILADDLGYGDLGCYGNGVIKTPHIDKIATEGVRFTDFCAPNALCSPSRASMLTGRYAHRTGVTIPVRAGKDTFVRRMLAKIGLVMGDLGAIDFRGGESLADGLPQSEVTMAEALKIAGYKSALVGKWHLGDFTENDHYHPHKHGFDYFMGLNVANDDWPVALYRGEEELIEDVGLDQEHLTGMFTKEAVEFIERSKDDPFFLFLSHKDPHQPFVPSKPFVNRSEAGRYGDAVEEMDASVGTIMECLKRNGLDDDTIVIFTSDNGPWFNGSSGMTRGRKGQSFEGGYRVPMIARWPEKIEAGKTCRASTMGIDFFPTFLRLAGLKDPNDRIIDGKDIWGLLSGQEKKSPHEALFFFHQNELEGIRSGKWKYFRYINTFNWPIPLDKPNTFIGEVAGGRDYTPPGSDKSVPTMGTWPLLYNLELDSKESYNLTQKYPQVAQKLGRDLVKFENEFIANPRGWKN